MASSADIADWMVQEYRRNNSYLRQATAARQIREKFGEQFVYKNKNRNWAINADILEAFRKVTPDDTVWSRSRQLWRARRESDPPDSRMVR